MRLNNAEENFMELSTEITQNLKTTVRQSVIIGTFIVITTVVITVIIIHNDRYQS